MEQKITLKKDDWICPVCMAPVTGAERPIQASCCQAAVFHKDCMQKVALNAGYFFKCPTCNASKNFTHEMRSLGIYVPQQDASWEREPNAYEDLFYQYAKCDAETCECEEGREHVAEKGNWTLARCRTCGASGMHKKCGNLRIIDNWACAACVEIEKKADLEKKRMKQENAEKQRLAALHRIEEKSGENTDTDDDDFNMADIKISESCYQYFPYDKDDLHKYGNKQTLPDWRNLQLTVNLAHWTITPELCSNQQPKSVDNADIISGKSVDDDALLTPVRGETDKIIETIKGKAEKLKDLDAVIEKDSVSIIKPKCSIFPFVSNFLKSGAFIRDKRKLDMSAHLGPVPTKKPMLRASKDSVNDEDEKLDTDSFKSEDLAEIEKVHLNVPYNPLSTVKKVVLSKKSASPNAAPKSLRSEPIHGGRPISFSS